MYIRGIECYLDESEIVYEIHTNRKCHYQLVRKKHKAYNRTQYGTKKEVLDMETNIRRHRREWIIHTIQSIMITVAFIIALVGITDIPLVEVIGAIVMYELDAGLNEMMTVKDMKDQDQLGS